MVLLTGLISPPQEGAAEARKTSSDQIKAKASQTDRSGLEKAQDGPPPVKIFLDQSGRLIIQSEDTDALDRLENIMRRNKPPQRPYHVFEVKHARASWVTLNLKEYFEKEDSNRPSIFAFFGDDFGGNDDKEAQLGEKPPLRFIWDNDTNTIVVQGADEDDLDVIRDLIKLWDLPEKIDTSRIRYTKLIKVRYSRADRIVATIKGAFRDLLSANDKTFEGGDGEEESKRNGGGSGAQGGGFNFSGLKGKLSLEPETITNSVLVHVEGEDLLKIMEEIIKELDEAAKDAGSIGYYSVSGGLSGASLKKAIAAAISPNLPKAKPSNQQQQQQQNMEAQQQINQAKFEASAVPSGRSRGRNR
ncbi:MAG: hypothetical protein VXZ82_14380 [Planctomycetota bacterium]|nr:hypothetical protein [Planctomycetota bacterium]